MVNAKTKNLHKQAETPAVADAEVRISMKGKPRNVSEDHGSDASYCIPINHQVLEAIKSSTFYCLQNLMIYWNLNNNLHHSHDLPAAAECR